MHADIPPSTSATKGPNEVRYSNNAETLIKQRIADHKGEHVLIDNVLPSSMTNISI
jgi:hypothetical protein